MNRILNDGCKWIIDLNNGEKPLEFSTEAALDKYIQDKIKDGTWDVKDGDLKIFQSVDLVERTKRLLDNIKAEISGVAVWVTPDQIKADDSSFNENSEEIEGYYKIPNSIGVNKFLQGYVNPDTDKYFVQPFNEDAWRKSVFNSLTKPEDGKDPLSEEEANKLISEIQGTWPKLSKIGTEIHKLFEAIFSGEVPVWKDGMQLSRSQFDSTVSQIKTLKQNILAQYPDATFYTEFGIMTKDIAPEIKDLIGKKDSINGKIDLIVVDNQGNAHIYDFKVSRKSVGDWKNHEAKLRRARDEWDLGKLEAASYQLAFYAAMLKQKGITVRDANIVPVKIDLTYENPEYKVGVKSIDKVNIDPTIDHLPDVLSGKYGTVANQTITQEFKTTSDDVLNMIKIFNEFFPKNTTLQRREEVRANVEHYRNNPAYVTVLRPSDKNYSKYKFILREKGLPGNPVKFIENEEKLEEALNLYVNKLSSAKTEFCIDFGHTLQDVFAGVAEITKLSERVSDTEKDWVEKRFERYIKDEGWSFDSNEDLISAGIFIFTKGGKSEVVILERNDLNTVIDLGLGKTILGKNTKDKYIDKNKILQSSNGNLALMQAMIYIAAHQDDFKNRMISEVSVVNVEQGEEQTHLPSKLIYNYNTLCDKNPSVEAIKISPDIFYDDAQACIQNAESRLSTIDVDLLGLVKAGEVEKNTKPYLELLISGLKAQHSELYSIYDEKDINYKSPIWQAYHYLNTALLSYTGEFSSGESSSEMWFNKGMRLNGYMISSPQFSSSADLRQLGTLLQNYENNVARAVYEAGWKMEQQFMKLYDEEGNGTQVFRSWFRRNTDGSLDERLLLKDPDDSDFDGSSLSRETLRMFLRTVAELKRPNLTEADIEQMKLSNEYYEVPLTEAVWSRQIKGNIQDEGVIKGTIKTIRDKWKEITTLTKNVFAEDEVEAITYKANHQGQLYNKFDLSGTKRLDKIRDHGIGFFETNLELIFNQVLVAYKRIEVAKDYIPRIQAMKLALKYAHDHGGVENKTIQDVFNKIIKSKFYGESIIEGETLQAVYKWLSFVRSIFTTMTLSINVPSFLRESLQGIYTGLSRAGVKMLPGVDMKTYTKALTHVIQDAHKNFSSVSMLQQLNAIYQMANQSVTQMANQRRLNWGNIKNWSKDTLFLTATAPDFMHRVSILVAKMMGDGCWEAHSLVDGKLVYDYKKDKRFEQYVNNNTEHKDYLKQKSLYEKMIEEFNKAGFKNAEGKPIQIGDDLPQAYTPTESQSIKNHADLLYGHYDESSRALISDTFIGSFVLQYKTYITAKFEQWTMPQGIYNTSLLKQQFDPITGEELYQKIVYDTENKPHREIVRKSQVTQEEIDKGDARVYYDYEGIPMEGLFQEFLHFGKALAKMDFKTFKELWDNPTDRGFFLLALHDQFLMALLMMLATFVFGNVADAEHPWNIAEVSKEIKKMGPLQQVAFNVIEGSTVDAQFIGLGKGNQGILQGMASNPPTLTAIQRFISTNARMINGKQSLPFTAAQNIGAIRTFQGVLKNIDPKQNQ